MNDAAIVTLADECGASTISVNMAGEQLIKFRIGELREFIQRVSALPIDFKQATAAAENAQEVAVVRAPVAVATSDEQIMALWRECSIPTDENNHATGPLPFARALLKAALCEQEVLTDVVRDVLAERQRQVNVEGWTPEHDDEHANGSMAIAAACYALADVNRARPGALSPLFLWRFTGWAESWWKPKSRRSNLVRSGALILAEIERLDRAVAPTLLGVADGESA